MDDLYEYFKKINDEQIDEDVESNRINFSEFARLNEEINQPITEQEIVLYKYYINERVIVRMFTLTKWLSTEAKPRLVIIFEGWTFLLLPSQECIIRFIIPKLLSDKKRYVNGAGEEDAAF